MTTGSIGTPASCAIRAAPFLNALSSKEREIVASGKTPTISPSRRNRTACAYDAAPADRSTGMCFMARISGPLTLCVNTLSLAMNRTKRRAGRAAYPA